MIQFRRFLLVPVLVVFTLLLGSCSESRTGPAWTCAPQGGDPTAKPDQGPIKPLPCKVQVKGKDLLVSLDTKKGKWYLFAAHPKGGQVKAELTITPKWGDAVVLQAKPRTPDCTPKDCIFPLSEDHFKTLKKSKKFSIKLTRAVMVPHNIKHEKFAEEFTNRGLSQALQDAGF